MMRIKAAMAILLLLLTALPVAAQEVRVRLTGVVQDADGEPMSGLVVTATAKGAVAVRSLTNREGNFQLLLRPGIWTISAGRLAGEPVVSREVRLRAGSERSIELKQGETYERLQPAESAVAEQGDVGDARLADTLQAVEVDAGQLDKPGKEAAVELSRLTDTVLLLARQRIAGQLAAKRFNASFWLVDQLNAGGTGVDVAKLDAAGGGQWRDDSYRLGLNLGNENLSGNILETNDVMVGVPVNVTIGVRQNRLNELRNSLTDASGESRTTSRQPGLENSSPWSDMLQRERNDDPFGTRSLFTDSLDSAGSTDESSFSFTSLISNVGRRIFSLYRPLRDEYQREAPRTNELTRGANFGVEKTFLDGLRGTVQYTYNESDGLDIQSVNLHFEDIQDFERFLETGLRHDLSTTVEASFGLTGTRVGATYKLYLADIEDDYTPSDNFDLGQYSRVDLNLSQRINFGLLSNARISLNVAVSNLLNNRGTGFLLGDDSDLASEQRKYIGGIRIEF